MSDRRPRSTPNAYSPRRRGAVAGFPFLKKSKYNAVWSYYDGAILHASGLKDCLGPVLCRICSKRKEHDSSLWYRSKAEAVRAQELDKLLAHGTIRAWRRSKSILLVDAPKASDRIRYQPDFDVWVDHDPPSLPNYRIEQKGGRTGIAYSGKIKIRMYRKLVRNGLQPPLMVIDAKGKEIDV